MDVRHCPAREGAAIAGPAAVRTSNKHSYAGDEPAPQSRVRCLRTHVPQHAGYSCMPRASACGFEHASARAGWECAVSSRISTWQTKQGSTPVDVDGGNLHHHQGYTHDHCANKVVSMAHQCSHAACRPDTAVWRTCPEDDAHSGDQEQAQAAGLLSSSSVSQVCSCRKATWPVPQEHQPVPWG